MSNHCPTCGRPTGTSVLCDHCTPKALAPGPGSEATLPNDTLIRFCNALDALHRHTANCTHCAAYLLNGDDKLCELGRVTITREMAFTDTNPVFPQNTPPSGGNPSASAQGSADVDKPAANL
jgi:hypothetical protein